MKPKLSELPKSLTYTDPEDSWRTAKYTPREISPTIQYHSLGLNQERRQPRTPGLLKGKLSEAFFEPLPTEELQQWE